MNNNQSTIEVPYLQIFNEENWPNYLAKKYLINSHTFYMDEEDIQFFIDDCTNPDYQKLKIKDQIQEVIRQKLNGQSFLKVYGRTAKDINSTMTKILNIQDLTMAIKMSQFLTQALDDELSHQKQQKQANSSKQIRLKFTLRQYKNYLQSPTQQYRLYLLNDKIVAICQKVPNHISVEPNEQQIQKGKQLAKNIHKGILQILKNQGNDDKKIIDIKVVVDCFISQTGKKAKILSIDSINPLHCLSLFTEQQLKETYQKYEQSQTKETHKPITKHIKTAQQFKQVDLSYYRVGWQLGDKEAFQEWEQFIKQN